MDSWIHSFLGLFGYSPFMETLMKRRPRGQRGPIPFHKKMISRRILSHTMWSKTDCGVPISMSSCLSALTSAEQHKEKESCLQDKSVAIQINPRREGISHFYKAYQTFPSARAGKELRRHEILRAEVLGVSLGRWWAT